MKSPRDFEIAQALAAKIAAINDPRKTMKLRELWYHHMIAATTGKPVPLELTAPEGAPESEKEECAS